MPRLALVLALLFGWIIAFAVLDGVRADVLSPEEAQKLETARGLVARIDKQQEEQKGSFNGLLELRDQIEPVRQDLGEIIGVLQQRLDAAQAQLAEFGPVPAADAPPEAEQQTADRQAAQAQVADIGNHLHGARALMVRADQLWDELTNARRDLFSSRILEHRGSFLEPMLWWHVVDDGVPSFNKKASWKWLETRLWFQRKVAHFTPSGPVGLLAVSLLALIWLRIALPRRMRRVIGDDGDIATQDEVVTHAAFVLVIRTLPYAALALAVWGAVTLLELVPGDVGAFLIGVSRTALAYGIGLGALEATLSPQASKYRMIRTDDRTARRLARVMRSLLLVYLVGLVALGLVALMAAPVSLTVVVTGLAATATVMVGSVLLREPTVDPTAPIHGSVRAPLHLLRPLFWVFTLTIVGALLFGFMSLSGFIVGRTLASLVILCLMVFVHAAIDTVFHDALEPGRAANAFVARNIGVKPSSVDLVGTIVAGLLRVMTVGFTVLVLLSPWGVEFGNLNPFEDVFFGVRFGELRGWIGAAGIALVLFGVGLVTTRLFVTWLDNQLLPRTAINPGSRNSISTIAGYVGFLLALTVALSQAGVQLQNVALVASALSVGIGFGLQQIVSNFVAGLIVLAERPIRVGDVIVVKGEEGKVRKINVRATELLLGENSTVVVPNSDIVSSIVKNRSLSDATHRATMKFVLVHESDLARVFDTLLTAARAHPIVLAEPAPAVFVTNVTDVGIEVELHVICNNVAKLSSVRSDLFLAILEAFRERGVQLARNSSHVPPPEPPATTREETA